VRSEYGGGPDGFRRASVLARLFGELIIFAKVVRRPLPSWGGLRPQPKLTLAKNAKKTKTKTCLNLGDLCVFARDLTSFAVMTYTASYERSLPEKQDVAPLQCNDEAISFRIVARLAKCDSRVNTAVVCTVA